jgi:hypothetical protein
MSRAHRVLGETEAAILREWEALEAERQHLRDWRIQLEECTKTASLQFASVRSQLERDCKEYKRDLRRVCERELEASWREKKVARREEVMTQKEGLMVEYKAKLDALNKTIEDQRVRQTETAEELHKWQLEL